jgi:hypothetical protein
LKSTYLKAQGPAGWNLEGHSKHSWRRLGLGPRPDRILLSSWCPECQNQFPRRV